MEEAIVVNKGEEALDLPPGFRFHPTDEEIITYYLTEKVLNRSFSATAIGEADLNKCEPWDLPKIAKMGEKNEWYFFCQRDRKYPTGMRTNRATECGYWKATGKDKEIYKGKGKDNLVGMKKTLVFYTGRAPKGQKSNWVMHEFRLQPKFPTYTLPPNSAKEEWVVCKIFHKPTTTTTTTPDMFKNTIPSSSSCSVPELLRMNSLGDDLLDCSSLPTLMDPPTNFKASSSSDAYYNSLPNKAESAEEYDMHNPIPNYYSMICSNNQMNFSTPITQHQIGTLNGLTTSLSDHNHNYYRNTPTSTYATSNVFKMAVKSEYMCGGIGLMEMDKECNYMDQMSSKSNHSSLTNDRNAETSSAVSNNNTTTAALYHQDLTPPSLPPLSDFECLWDDYS